jgi:hypothetical protein
VLEVTGKQAKLLLKGTNGLSAKATRTYASASVLDCRAAHSAVRLSSASNRAILRTSSLRSGSAVTGTASACAKQWALCLDGFQAGDNDNDFGRSPSKRAFRWVPLANPDRDASVHDDEKLIAIL